VRGERTLVAVPPLTGRVAVVTGATQGIGREVARGLVRLGATTVLVGRGADRTAAVARSISGNGSQPAAIPLPVADLAVRAEQYAVTSELTRRYPKIDILVNNAGGIFTRREVTADGLERTFALNVLAPFVLTTELTPALQASGAGRVVNVASAAHQGHHVELDDLQGARRYGGWRAYGRSKLELILLSREFARRLQGTGVTVNAVHPGFVRSGFAQNNPGAMRGLVRFTAWIGGRSPERGAQTPLFAATDPSLAHVTGEYLSNRRVRPGSAASRDPDTARRLYDACAALAHPA